MTEKSGAASTPAVLDELPQTPRERGSLIKEHHGTMAATTRQHVAPPVASGGGANSSKSAAIVASNAATRNKNRAASGGAVDSKVRHEQRRVRHREAGSAVDGRAGHGGHSIKQQQQGVLAPPKQNDAAEPRSSSERTATVTAKATTRQTIGRENVHGAGSDVDAMFKGAAQAAAALMQEEVPHAGLAGSSALGAEPSSPMAQEATLSAVTDAYDDEGDLLYKNFPANLLQSLLLALAQQSTGHVLLDLTQLPLAAVGVRELTELSEAIECLFGLSCDFTVCSPTTQPADFFKPRSVTFADATEKGTASDVARGGGSAAEPRTGVGQGANASRGVSSPGRTASSTGGSTGRGGGTASTTGFPFYHTMALARSWPKQARNAINARSGLNGGLRSPSQHSRVAQGGGSGSATALADQSGPLIRGPIFANVFVVHNIDLAPGGVQQVLLQAMRLRNISIDGTLHNLPRTHLILATHSARHRIPMIIQPNRDSGHSEHHPVQEANKRTAGLTRNISALSSVTPLVQPTTRQFFQQRPRNQRETVHERHRQNYRSHHAHIHDGGAGGLQRSSTRGSGVGILCGFVPQPGYRLRRQLHEEFLLEVLARPNFVHQVQKYISRVMSHRASFEPQGGSNLIGVSIHKYAQPAPLAWEGLRRKCPAVHCNLRLTQYIRDIAVAARHHCLVAFGPAPTKVKALVEVAKAHALLSAVTFVRPVDIDAVVLDVFSHLLMLRDFSQPHQQPGDLSPHYAARHIMHSVSSTLAPPK